MLDPFTVFQFAAVAYGVAASVPRFQAYERHVGVDGTGRPDCSERRVELQAEVRLPVAVEQSHFPELAVVEDIGVASEAVAGEFHDAVGQAELLMFRLHAALFCRSEVMKQEVLLSEVEESPLLGVQIEVAVVESRMASDLEMHFAVAGVFHIPDHLKAVVPQAVSDLQDEGEGIEFQGIFVALQTEYQRIFFLVGQLELTVACESVLSQFVGFPLMVVLVVL